MSLNPLDAVKAITGLFGKRSERKKLKQQAEFKLQKARIDGESKLDLTDAEWELVNVNKQDSSWKDEYVTIIITLPIPLILLGAIWLAFTNDDRLLNGVIKGIEALQAMNVDMGLLMMSVVGAAVGLKIGRGLKN